METVKYQEAGFWIDFGDDGEKHGFYPTAQNLLVLNCPKLFAKNCILIKLKVLKIANNNI